MSHFNRKYVTTEKQLCLSSYFIGFLKPFYAIFSQQLLLKRPLHWACVCSTGVYTNLPSINNTRWQFHIVWQQNIAFIEMSGEASGTYRTPAAQSRGILSVCVWMSVRASRLHVKPMFPGSLPCLRHCLHWDGLYAIVGFCLLISANVSMISHSWVSSLSQSGETATPAGAFMFQTDLQLLIN